MLSNDEAGTPERFRDAAHAIRERAQLRLFWVMTIALVLPGVAYFSVNIGKALNGPWPVSLLPVSIRCSSATAAKAPTTRRRRVRRTLAAMASTPAATGPAARALWPACRAISTA